jgi:hypothetical protein
MPMQVGTIEGVDRAGHRWTLIFEDERVNVMVLRRYRDRDRALSGQ